jgi:OOP family OmpA-OmpF porin
LLVEFETDRSAIEPVFQVQLNAFAKQVRESKEALRLIVSGHTDAEGTVAYNYELGLRRAKAVSDYLRRQGIPVERIEIMSYGEALPKRNNSTSEGKAVNRRAEVAVVRE